ncbi:hypothetical protein HPB52_017645 [Rhipicephalus sanguineus]|uniref:Uncharacterized protein n=1 Tax=Rhipicephalus sanguineus TaxID=34632 RepID=A0A9D4Q1J3_RHISA|nr:hypothetical protein HPB52_017645 [Rhipicephalus sanguineus]
MASRTRGRYSTVAQRSRGGDPRQGVAGITASEGVAVAWKGLRSDLGTRVQTRAREIEEELSRYCVETGNRIPVNARHFIMARVFELVQLCSDLRADAACERGAVMALQGQLIETRREAADMHRRAVLAEARTAAQPFTDQAHLPAAVASAQTRPGFPAGLQGAPPLNSGTTPAAMSYAAALRAGVPAAPASSRTDDVAPASGQPLHEHVAFVTPIAPSATPARDSLRLLKENIDPVAHNIRDVTLRHTRYGLTVFARTRDTLTHMRQAIADNAITCAALSMRIPDRRNPHVRFSGVDPDISQSDFIDRVRDRNPQLQLDPQTCKVRASFRERSGTSAVIAEVDPAAFRRIMTQQRISTVGPCLVVHEAPSRRQDTDQPIQTATIMAADPVVTGLLRPSIEANDLLPLRGCRRRTPGWKQEKSAQEWTPTRGHHDAYNGE